MLIQSQPFFLQFLPIDPLPASSPSSRMLRDAEGGTNGKYLLIKSSSVDKAMPMVSYDFQMTFFQETHFYNESTT